MTDYNNKSQSNLITIMELLSEGFPEVSAAEIRKRTGIATDVVFRTLHQLQAADWIERLDGGYRLSSKWPKIGIAYGEHLREEWNKAHKRLQEFRN